MKDYGPPNWDRLRKTFLRQGEADRVPYVEAGIEKEHKERFLGRPVKTLADEVEFWQKIGADYVPVTVGLRRLFWPGYATSESVAQKQAELTTNVSADYEGSGHQRTRAWAAEGKGIIANREDFESFPWPSVEEIVDEPTFRELERMLPPNMKAIAYVGYVFTSVWWLMGFEGFTNALADDPELVRDLFRKTGETQLEVCKRLVEFPAVGAIWHPDDMAYTEGLMVSPKLLREHIFPWYKQMGDVCRAADRVYMLHTDGDVSSVLDDIVNCGFQVLHPLEPKAMDIEKTKREYGDKLALIGNIDLIYTLTRGTPEEVEAEVKERIRVLGPGGGYAVSSANSVTEYVPYENFIALVEAVKKHGRYPLEV